MSSSRESLPCSTSCMTAVQVNNLETDPGRKRVVSGSTGISNPDRHNPYPFEKKIWPSLTTTKTAPGTWFSCMDVYIAPSKKADNSFSSLGPAMDSCAITICCELNKNKPITRKTNNFCPNFITVYFKLNYSSRQSLSHPTIQYTKISFFSLHFLVQGEESLFEVDQKRLQTISCSQAIK